MQRTSNIGSVGSNMVEVLELTSSPDGPVYKTVRKPKSEIYKSNPSHNLTKAEYNLQTCIDNGLLNPSGIKITPDAETLLNQVENIETIFNNETPKKDVDPTSSEADPTE